MVVDGSDWFWFLVERWDRPQGIPFRFVVTVTSVSYQTLVKREGRIKGRLNGNVEGRVVTLDVRVV